MKTEAFSASRLRLKLTFLPEKTALIPDRKVFNSRIPFDDFRFSVVVARSSRSALSLLRFFSALVCPGLPFDDGTLKFDLFDALFVVLAGSGSFSTIEN